MHTFFSLFQYEQNWKKSPVRFHQDMIRAVTVSYFFHLLKKASVGQGFLITPFIYGIFMSLVGALSTQLYKLPGEKGISLDKIKTLQKSHTHFL